MLDARFLIDVHFRQGGKNKESFPPNAEAAGINPPHVQSPAPSHFQTEEWHSEEERIGSIETNSTKHEGKS